MFLKHWGTDPPQKLTASPNFCLCTPGKFIPPEHNLQKSWIGGQCGMKGHQWWCWAAHARRQRQAGSQRLSGLQVRLRLILSVNALLEDSHTTLVTSNTHHSNVCHFEDPSHPLAILLRSHHVPGLLSPQFLGQGNTPSTGSLLQKEAQKANIHTA